MRRVKFNLLLIYTILFLIVTTMPAYPSNRNVGRIRGSASRQNDRIYNKIAIDLVNGRSNNISIDNMSKLLKSYNIVQFDQAVNVSTRDMIIKEVAYRMIRNSYLPTVNDKIKVYRKSAEFSQHALPRVRLVLPVNNTRIKEDRIIDTLRWPEMSSQVSQAVENLWISRIQSSSDDPAAQQENMEIVDVLAELKTISDNESAYSPWIRADVTSKNGLSEAVDFIFTSWQVKGIVSEKDLPAIAGLLRQYIILNSSNSLSNMARDVRGLKDVDTLHGALVQSIYSISQNIKNNNPSDFAALAMLQAMLSDISYNMSTLSIRTDNARPSMKSHPERP